MDKAIELVLVATVAVVVATVAVFLVQGESKDFGEFVSGQTSSAQCELWGETCNPKYTNAENSCAEKTGKSYNGDYKCDEDTGGDGGDGGGEGGSPETDDGGDADGE